MYMYDQIEFNKYLKDQKFAILNYVPYPSAASWHHTYSTATYGLTLKTSRSQFLNWGIISDEYFWRIKPNDKISNCSFYTIPERNQIFATIQ